MGNIIGKVVTQFHMRDKEAQVLAAKNYRRKPDDPKFPFGKEVTLIVMKSFYGWTLNKGQKIWGLKSGGAEYSGIILGPKFNSDGSADENVIGIGTQNEILDFQIDPNAPEADGHATLMDSAEHTNDFAEITGRWVVKK